MEIKKKIIHRLKSLYRNYYLPYRLRNKTKVFCIGRNKTGTTSLKKAFEDLGYIVGEQRKAEMLLPFYKKGNFKPIIDYCNTAQVFQDFPFSFPETYKHLDAAFPKSKFILSVRDSPEQWYNSLLKFHSKLFGDGHVPSAEQLKSASYVWKGFVWECNRIVYATPEDDPYNKSLMIKSYNDYNRKVIEYFKNRPDDLLIINLSEMGSYQKLIDFLGITSPFDDFPWENKTSEIKSK